MCGDGVESVGGARQSSDSDGNTTALLTPCIHMHLPVCMLFLWGQEELKWRQKRYKDGITRFTDTR